MIFLITIILGILVFIYDINHPKSDYKLCPKHAYLILLIHHIICVFAQIGWLSNDKNILYIYLFAEIITIIGQIIFKKCIITILVNKYCNITGRFRDIFYYLNISLFKILIYYFFTIIITLYKLRSELPSN